MTRRTECNLDLLVDMYDAGGNLIEPLAKVADWDLGKRAYQMMAEKYPDQNIVLRRGARTIHSSNPRAR